VSKDIPSYTSKDDRLDRQAETITRLNGEVEDLKRRCDIQQNIINGQRRELEQKAPENVAITNAEQLFKEMGT
jgi:hypothetical protein